MKILVFIALLCALSATCSAAAWGNKDKVRMEEVKVLTLKKGEWTNARRSSAVKQLDCVGGAASKFANTVEVVQCQNVGSDGYDAQWKCEADLDKSIKFGKIEVNCEGYDYPEDPYILRGSCGLEYTLEYTGYQKAANQQPNQYQQYQQNAQSQRNYHSQYDDTSIDSHSSPFRGIGKLFMFAVVAFIFYNVYKQCVAGAPSISSSGHYTGGGSSGGWGPGGGGGGGGGGGPYGSANYAPGCAPGYTAPSAPYANQWRPGFWSGLAGGAMLGNWWNRPRTGGFFGGGYHHTPAYNSAPHFSSPFGGGGGGGGISGGGGGGGGGSRTASGFGGTRRR